MISSLLRDVRKLKTRWLGSPAMLLASLLAVVPALDSSGQKLAGSIRNKTEYASVKKRAEEVIRSGFNAGDGYAEIWIRDYNTFIELSAKVLPAETLRENLLIFFKLQGDDGNIIDGFVPKEKAGVGYDYRYSPLAPEHAGHKNTVETDQESSLVQAIYKYIQATGDKSMLDCKVGNKSVADRLEWSLDYLMNDRYAKEYGLLYGATTADWGDVQPEHDWGVYLTPDTHKAIDVYDNAMFLIALDDFMQMAPAKKARWLPVRNRIAANVRKHLWDAEHEKFRPHVYLDGSPFPKELDEDAIYYHGGTAVAIEAGLLSRKEVLQALEKMIANMKASGAGSIGLTMYPPYPAGAFRNAGMYPYGYQNGGDWTWFGARMIQQLIHYGYIEQAVANLQPMIDRVEKNNGFFEWYTVNNQPKGSGTFRGEAGVLYKAILMLQEWAAK
jgi:glycogen debranching enzyme